MTQSEHTNRAHKAVAITVALRTAGCDADAARNLDDAGWQLAAKVAAHNEQSCPCGSTHDWTDASDRTRAIVIGRLVDGETDVFEQVAAAQPAGSPSARGEAHDLDWCPDDDGMAAVVADVTGAEAGDVAAWLTRQPTAPPAVVTGRAVQSSRPPAAPERTADERALAAAVDQAIARQHPTEPEDPNDGAYRNWCENNDMDPDDPAVTAAYQDWLDFNGARR